MSEIFSETLSKIFGTRWFLFFLAALIIFLVCGVWIASTPAYETMYNHRTLPRVQTETVTMDCHIIEIGNTGRKIQDDIDLLFYTDAYEKAAMMPKAENFGKSDRKTEIEKTGGVTIMRLGAVKPDMRVEVKLLFVYKKNDTPYSWDDIFKGIETSHGEVVEGDPGWTTVGRMLFAVFG